MYKYKYLNTYNIYTHTCIPTAYTPATYIPTAYIL